MNNEVAYPLSTITIKLTSSGYSELFIILTHFQIYYAILIPYYEQAYYSSPYRSINLLDSHTLHRTSGYIRETYI